MKNSFFSVVIHKDETIPDLYGLCVGFENRTWRKEQLVNYLFDYLPEFALNYSEFHNLTGHNVVSMMRNVAANIYQSEKFKSRGEFGELLLHAIIRETNNTIPAISKIFYKDGPNETVKGFDAIHVVDKEESLELWLGEVKFYNDISSAIRDVIDELRRHAETRYIRNEFITIMNKIDNSWPHADKLRMLLNPNTSLDDVFGNTCIPVLLTYDSSVLAKYTSRTDEYLKEISMELERLHLKFCRDLGDYPLTIHLFLLPLHTKAELNNCLDEKLRVWQNI